MVALIHFVFDCHLFFCFFNSSSSAEGGGSNAVPDPSAKAGSDGGRRRTRRYVPAGAATSRKTSERFRTQPVTASEMQESCGQVTACLNAFLLHCGGFFFFAEVKNCTLPLISFDGTYSVVATCQPDRYQGEANQSCLTHIYNCIIHSTRATHVVSCLGMLLICIQVYRVIAQSIDISSKSCHLSTNQQPISISNSPSKYSIM